MAEDKRFELLSYEKRRLKMTESRKEVEKMLIEKKLETRGRDAAAAKTQNTG
mgnify:CR=1